VISGWERTSIFSSYLHKLALSRFHSFIHSESVDNAAAQLITLRHIDQGKELKITGVSTMEVDLWVPK
jgi:hypothetical protein